MNKSEMRFIEQSSLSVEGAGQPGIDRPRGHWLFHGLVDVGQRKVMRRRYREAEGGKDRRACRESIPYYCGIRHRWLPLGRGMQSLLHRPRSPRGW